jgi:hypothetical protein
VTSNGEQSECIGGGGSFVGVFGWYTFFMQKEASNEYIYNIYIYKTKNLGSNFWLEMFSQHIVFLTGITIH